MISIIIPTYNRREELKHLLASLKRQYCSVPFEVVVVDDGSTDETPCLLARQPVDVIRHARNRGYGQTMIDAFRWAQCYGYDWLITMDCDEQHEPASLPEFREAIDWDDADVISGSRYLDMQQGGDAPPPDRRAVNAAITALIGERLALRITDAFCGFKAYRVQALKKLRLDEKGYAFPLQFWVQAAAHDLRIKEVPIRLIYKDPSRSFGGTLDNADHRLAHYKQVFAKELARFPEKFGAVCCTKCATGEGAQVAGVSGQASSVS